MNEQHARRPDGPWSEDWLDRSETPGQANPTEQFPTERFPTEQFPTAQFPPAEQPEPQRYEPQRFAHPHQPAQPYARPPEPLAHEGGFPYGMPPAAPYGPTAPYGPGQQFGYADQYIPQHLHVAPHQFPQGPYPPQFGYPPMQQTVYVHGGQVRRVNHALHLILTLLTFGLWLPVWIILAIAGS
ncbi:hypothetical protein [Dietzia sp. KRD202]|uniref:hypothetical protein n=1 Tax=Dietzia sp. KRD202 TaxID=2729732 RepID=UPI001F49FACC|nr:hypothetical protein [Dietzia sp. KRD202]